ncbi:MAG: 5'/3'-nucleotidase SurE [Vampirovibrionales bacterium]
MNRLTVLVSNDDGIYAEGLRTLVEWLSKHHDVVVVAPDRERSAMGHALTLHKPLRVDPVPFNCPVKAAFAITGTPSDCVKIAINAIFPQELGLPQPDVVVSGINHGPNLGNDVLYSGTVSAASEGALHGIPSMAVSLINGSEKFADFNPSAEFVCHYLPTFMAAQLPVHTVLNLNTPAVSLHEMAGVQVCKLGERNYSNLYERRTDPRGNVYYWLAGEALLDGAPHGTDIAAVRDNFVSATPIQYDLTHVDVLNNATYTQALTVCDGVACLFGGHIPTHNRQEDAW